jgi:hypothetical protein
VDTAAFQRCSTARVIPPVRPRKLAKVPFVELADRRLQGVVSSGSDPDRVYVSWIGAGSHDFNCSTNNNRPCGGLRGSPCNHLRALADEAVRQYGADHVARYLRIDTGGVAGGGTAGEPTGDDLIGRLHGRHEPTPAAVVFSRFLRHLAYLELPGSTGPIPELHWFPATSGAR